MFHTIAKASSIIFNLSQKYFADTKLFELKRMNDMGLGGIFSNRASWNKLFSDTGRHSLLSNLFIALSMEFQGGITKSYFKSGSVCFLFLKWSTCFHRSSISFEAFVGLVTILQEIDFFPRLKFCTLTSSFISKF